MSKGAAIRVNGLGKRYVLGGAEKAEVSFREMLVGLLLEPFRRLKRLQGERAEEESFWALKGVNFDIMPGEVVGIIGCNGAGKSTLLKILSRITDPTEGKVEIRGRVSSLLEVGTGFHPELTGRENIFLNGAILGMARREIRSKFDEIVAFAEVEKFLDTPVKRYSSGMYVRLAFAVAAHLEPEILIVDEVLAVGDVAFQKKCLGKMSDVSKEGRTVLFVSHNMGAIRSLCNRVVLLNQGSVVEDGEPEDIIEHYLSYGQEVEAHGEVVWTEDAPQCSELELTRIRLVDCKGHTKSLFDASSDIYVEIEYCIKQPVRGMRIVMSVVTSEGVVAFASTDHHNRQEHVLPEGIHFSTCCIPGNLLNGGLYMINLRIGIPGVKPLIPGREYLSLTIESLGSHGSTFPEKWPGVVAPVLRWTTGKRQ